MTDKPGFYAIIPANVRYDEQLSAAEKLVYAEISALLNEEGTCYAKNTYFMRVYGASERTVTGWIKHLEDRGYISVTYSRDGRGMKRYITLTGDMQNHPQKIAGAAEICGYPPAENCGWSPAENCGCSNKTNTSITNTRYTKSARGETLDIFTEFVRAEFPGGAPALMAAFEDFDKNRKRGSKCKEWTAVAAKRICQRLKALAKQAGVNDRAGYMTCCLDESIMRGWAGVFAAKDFVDSDVVHKDPRDPDGPAGGCARVIGAEDDITDFL